MLGGGEAVIETDHGRNQATAGDFVLRGGAGGGRIGEAHVCETCETNGFCDGGLADVLVNRVVGDEDGGGCGGAACHDGRCRSCALGVEKLIVINGVGQERGAGYGAVERRCLRLAERRSEVGFILLRALDGLRQSDRR